MESPQVKIALSGPDGEVETLWANPTPDGLYALDNHAARPGQRDTQT